MFFKKFADEREGRDWLIVRWGRCGSRLGNGDNEAGFSIKCNKVRGNREVENVAEGRGNGGRGGFLHPCGNTIGPEAVLEGR